MTNLTSWLDIPADSDFSIYNLPLGIFSTAANALPRAGIAIGDHVLDLSKLAASGVLKALVEDASVFEQSSLNAYIALGKSCTNSVRTQIQSWLCEKGSPIHQDQSMLVPMADAQMHMPVAVGDYTDFYSSIEHATNVGKMFRDPANALLPNWRHIPVGYHGRASSIIVSGTPIHRPKGQVMPKDADAPIYQASGRLDFELEMAFVIGKENTLGDPIATTEAKDYIFGMVLFNDWSARDIQKWEYVPLGPFLGKNFASSISPWIVPLEALAAFGVQGPVQEPAVLPYLQYEGAQNYDIHLEVGIEPEGAVETVVSRSNFKYMYWNMLQQLAHHTVNGCNVRVGDMLASGTISGKDETSYGSMLEISWAGSKPQKMSDGSERKFINDHDTVIMRGYAEKDGMRVGFGEVRTRVLPAR
ncbi:MAG: fumarylacetoacetase [Bacteroidota bacterium]